MKNHSSGIEINRDMSRGLKWWNLVDISVTSSSDNEDQLDADENEHKTTDGLTPTGSPRGVSEPILTKFQELQERRVKDKQDISKMLKRRGKRIRKRSAGQHQQVIPHDNEIVCDRRAGKQRGDQTKGEEITSKPSVAPESLKPCESEDTEQRWTKVKGYFDCNSHLKGVDPGRHAPKSGLEEKIDHAIESGDYKLAELYSDTLAKREFAVRVSKAFDCVEYVKKRNEAERQRKKKRKLQWAFEGKHRWETKSNM
jgi:hypothetical protein